MFYSAGNLFSWVANGDMSNRCAGRTGKQSGQDTSRRWSEGWALLPTISELDIASE